MVRPLRILVALGVSAVVTVGLFYLMDSLIRMRKAEQNQAIRGRVIDFVRLKTQSTTQVKERRLPQKVQPKQAQPKAPSIDMPTGGDGEAVNLPVDVAAPSVDQGFRVAGGPHLGAAPSDAEIAPLVRVQPIYPRRAQVNGIEGWVMVAFSIGVTGKVKSPRVIAAKPVGVFEKAAIRAIKKWKYRPQVENGVAIEKGQEVKLTFQLPDK